MRCTFLSLFAFAPFALLAQPTLNTTCATAVALPVSGTNVQSEFLYIDNSNFPNAAPDPVTACSGSNPQRIGWFKFTAINSTHWLRTEGANVYGHTLEVFSGSCGSLTGIQCIPSGDPYQVLSGLTVGDVYFVRVLAPFFCNSSDGNCQVGLAVVSAPTNNDCNGALELTVRNSALTVNPATEIASIGCTQSQPECAGAPGSADDDCWFRFTATGSAHHFPYTLLHGGTPTIQWFSGSCGSLTSLACNDQHATGLTPGQQYYIRMHSNVNDPEQQLRLLGDVCESAPNDECSGATPIAVANTGEEAERVRVSFLLGTGSTVPCGSTTNDVWLSFTAPSTSVAVTGDASAAVALFSGSCGALVCEGTGNLNFPITPAMVFNDLTVGNTYFLKVGYWFSWNDVGIRVLAAPANDECGSATPLSVLPYAQGEGYIHGSTAAATTGSSTCNASVADVWYSFTATADQHLISIESDRVNAFIDLEVLSGSCGSLTSVFCDTDNQDHDPTLVSGLVPGTSYLVRVFTPGGSAPGFFRIAVTQGLPNDECAGAIELLAQPLATYPTLGQSWINGAAPGTSTCLPVGKDVWYRFTPVGTTATFLSLQPGSSGFQGSVELFSGTCGTLSSMSCTDLTTNARALFSGLTPGVEYFVRLAGNNFAYSFIPMIVQAPVNDGISGAIVAPVASAFAPPSGIGHGYGATQSLPAICAGAADDDTWYRFTATATSHTVRALQSNFLFTETALGFGLQIEVFDTLTTDMAELATHNIGCGGSGSAAVSGLTVGNDYWYRVFTPGVAPAEVNMFATWIQGESSDEPAGAVELTYGQNYSHALTTTGATQTLPGADCSTDDFADDDIWFKFTATAAPARIVAGYGTADLTLELFSGTPGNLTSLACDDNVLVLPALTSGQTYYLRLYSWRNATPVEGRIGLLTTPSLTANDCVDETCLGPVLLPNPGIEQGGYCQTGIMSVSDIVGLGVPLAPGWPRTGIGSSDAYSSCTLFDRIGEMPGAGLGSEHTISRSGNGMAGILLSDFGDAAYREYISAPLSEPLIPGEPYLVSFSAKAAIGSGAYNGIGAYLSEGIVAQPGYQALPVQPQVVAQDIIGAGPWTTICGIVVPDAAWDRITVGSFFQHTTEYTYQGSYGGQPYYFIDDVVVARVTDPGCITSIGDVPPLDESTGSEGDALRVYPNPANELLNIIADPSLFGQRVVIEVFDATGSRVHAEQVNYFNALQPLDLSQDWKEGLYLVMVRVEGQAPKAARVVVRR